MCASVVLLPRLRRRLCVQVSSSGLQVVVQPKLLLRFHDHRTRNSGDVLRSMGFPQLVNFRRCHPKGRNLAGMSRATRRRLVRFERNSRDPLIVRRASAVRRLGGGRTVTEVSIEMAAARSSVQGWRDLFLRDGENGLVPLRRGPPPTTVTATLIQQLLTLSPHPPSPLCAVPRP